MVGEIEVNQEEITVKISELYQHPFHRAFYGDFELLDKIFSESVNKRGAVDKPIVNEDNQIISGYRRILAWGKNHDTIKVIRLKPQLFIKEAYLKEENDIIVELNCHREKLWSVRVKEIKYLFRKFEGRVGRPKLGANNYDIIINNPENSLSEIKAVSVQDYEDKLKEQIKKEGKLGRTRNIVSKLVNLNASFVYYVNKVDLNDERIKNVIESMDLGIWHQNDFIDFAKAILNEKNTKPLINKTSKPNSEITKTINDLTVKTKDSFIVKDKFELYCADSCNLEFIKNESVDLCTTSVPYADLRNYGKSPNNLGKLKDKNKIKEQYTKVFSELYRVLKPTANFFLNVGDKHLGNGELFDYPSQLKDIAVNDCKFILKNIIIYHKINYKKTNSKKSNNMSYEFIFHLVKDLSAPFYDVYVPTVDGEIKKERRIADYKANPQEDFSRKSRINTGWTKIPDFWYDGFVTVGRVADGKTFKQFGIDNRHPAEYPVEIPYLCTLLGSKEGDVVLDPFSGSGLGGVVALKLGRKYIGVEIEKEFFNNSQKVLLDTAIEYWKD